MTELGSLLVSPWITNGYNFIIQFHSWLRYDRTMTGGTL